MNTIPKNISPFNHKTDMPPMQFVIKKILAFWVCYTAGLFLAEGAAILLHFACGKNMLIGDVFDDRTITLIIYYGYIIVIGVTLFYWKKIEKRTLSEIGLTKHIGSYMAGILTAVLLLIISVGFIIATGNIQYCGLWEKTDIPIILLFGGGFIIQGAMEELLCRGFLLHTLKEKTSLPVAIGISTVMFIIPHLSSLFAGGMIYGMIGMINLIFISVIFSLFTIRFQSIWAACGLHSFWNFILYSVLGLNVSGSDEAVTAIFRMRSVGENIWNGGIYGIEASLITAIVLGVFALIFYHVAIKCKNASISIQTDTSDSDTPA